MDLIGIDFETYYSTDYSLSKLTTEEYVRDPQFETILVAIKINADPAFFVPAPDVARELRATKLERNAAYAHHAHFDGLILSHHYELRPKVWFDTLGMARALHGANGRLSLDKLAERYGIGAKGHEVHNVKGMRYCDFSSEALQRYGSYSINDIELEYQLLRRMLPQFSRTELEINDRVIRMFTEPELLLDTHLLEQYAKSLSVEKTTLLIRAGVQVADVMSNDKFAQELANLGVVPPRKISKTTGKLTWAFAKTDKAMQELQEHEDERVQLLVAARLKNKTTLAERGARRLIGMAQRGPATVYLKYSGASGTHRFSGGDKFNWQAMKRKSDLRRAVKAPPGHKIVVGDSSNIEARLLDWLAGQDDMVEVYQQYDAGLGPDVYCVVAGRIYERPIRKETDPDERQMGKVAKLGLGYGMGPDRFIDAVRGQATDKNGRPLVLSLEFAARVVNIYRQSHPQVRKLWRRGEMALRAIAAKQEGIGVDFRGIVKTTKTGLVFPGGLRIEYPDLEFEGAKDSQGKPLVDKYGQPVGEWTFWNGRNREHIYGAKLIENVIQCLARIIVMEQCLGVAKVTAPLARWKHSAHDEGVFLTHEFYAPWVLHTLLTALRTAPAWAPGLPLNAEGGIADRYGDAK